MAKSKPPYDLKAQLLINDAIQRHENVTIDYLEIKEADYKAKFVQFSEVKFNSLVLFDGAKLVNGLLFENCEFAEATVFRNVVADQYDQMLTPDSVSIVFKDCTFYGVVQFFGPETRLERSLVFENCVFSAGLHIEGIKITIEGLMVAGCTINEKLDIFRSSFRSGITLANSTVNTFLRLAALECNMAAFIKLNVSGNFHMDSCNCPNGIVFNDGTFKDDLSLSLNRTENSGLTIIGSTFEKSAIIDHHARNQEPQYGISSYHIDSAKFSNGIVVKGIVNIAAEFPKVKGITLNISSLLSGSIVFSDLDIGILNIGGYNTSAKITFKHTEIKQIRSKGLVNEGGLIFSDVVASRSDWPDTVQPNLMIGSALYIDDSNLGKAQFFRTNFRSYEKVVFSNIILTEIATSNVTWFTPEQLEDGMVNYGKQQFKATLKTKKVQEISQARALLIRELNSVKEIYRQLKFAAQKQGDIPLSHEFQR